MIALRFPRQLVRTALCALLIVLCHSSARAHSTGENYVFVSFHPDRIEGRFEIHRDDLSQKLGIQLDSSDPQRTARETASRVQQYISERFSIGPDDGQAYRIEFTDVTILAVPEGTFAQYHFRAATNQTPDVLRLHHAMLYEDDGLHRGLLLVEHNAKTNTKYPPEYVAMVFGPTSEDQTLDLTNIPSLLRPRDMIWQGVLHIWMGLDHVLFLLALMLPTVLVMGRDSQKPVASFPRALWNLLKIVTIFTIAHSMTLVLAALGVLDVPSRFVESMIALSIALVAINNITGRVREGSLIAILALGLFHGLGFATVMGHLPFRTVTLVRAVLGFNIGVELGQMALVALVFPMLYLLRTRPFYMPVVLKGGSLALILISSVWFVQRAFGLE